MATNFGKKHHAVDNHKTALDSTGVLFPVHSPEIS